MASDPQVIGGYRIVSRLGAGGMGTVYRAQQVSLGREVALKVLAPNARDDAEASERFLREARTAAAVSHPNVVAIIDVGRDRDQLYLVQELITGGNARDLMANSGGRVGERRALEIMVDCCAGLQAIHEAGLVHRDIKPENILLTGDGLAKLADFGLARSVGGNQEHLTVTGLTVGTPAYMSPEQAQGEKGIDIRSDVYSLGATLYALVTGVLPFQGDTVWAVVAKMLTEPIPDPRRDNPDLSADMAGLITRAMAKKPDERYATPGAMRMAVEAVLAACVDPPAGMSSTTRIRRGEGRPISTQKTALATPTVHTERPRRTRAIPIAKPPSRLPAVALGVAALVGMLGAIVVMRPGKTAKPVAPANATAAAMAVAVEPPSAAPKPPPTTASSEPPAQPIIAVIPSGPVELIPRGSAWRFLDDGSDQDTAWRSNAFDDHVWKSGTAPLGYGDSWIRTIVGFGPDEKARYRTTYFRHTFTSAPGTVFTSLTIDLMRDDGAVIYLNGVEVARSNMPDGAVTFRREAKSVVSNADESRYWPITIDHRAIRPGSNVIAVEVHQFGPTTDESFDLALTGR